uniref:P27 family phage terminase small subunit n=1 Tax=Steinernema glaseri TaxID=37863 RepID=A0A1I7YU05_9BILA
MPPKRVVKAHKVKEEPEEGDEERARKIQAVKDDVKTVRASGIGGAPVLDIDEFCRRYMEKLSLSAEALIEQLSAEQRSARVMDLKAKNSLISVADSRKYLMSLNTEMLTPESKQFVRHVKLWKKED